MLSGVFKKAVAAGCVSAALMMGAPSFAGENPAFTGRHIVADSVKKSCFSPADEDANANDSAWQLRDIFRKMGQKSRTGRLLMERARERDLAYCNYGSQGKGTGAVYRDYLGMVQMNLDEGPLYNSVAISHETLHGIQGGNALLKTTWNHSLEAVLRSLLYQEAAGDVAEVIVAYESKLNKSPAMWNYISAIEPGRASDQSGEAMVFKKKFDALQAQGISVVEATERAGSWAVEEKMKNRGWREFYLTRQTVYLGGLYDIGYFNLADQSRPLGFDLPPEVMKAAGEITPDLSFTRHAREPSRSDIFEGLPGLRYAFEALEFARLQKAYGPLDMRVMEARHYQEVLGNPYLDIDWGAVKKRYDAEKKFVPLNEIMDNIVKDKNQRALDVSRLALKETSGPG